MSLTLMAIGLVFGVQDPAEQPAPAQHLIVEARDERGAPVANAKIFAFAPPPGLNQSTPNFPPQRGWDESVR